jgi:hypothetical protein
MNLHPSGFTLQPWKGESLPTIITVSTDLPVHRVKHVNSLPEGGSPFLLISQGLGPKFLEWKDKVDGLQHLREHRFEEVMQLID